MNIRDSIALCVLGVSCAPMLAAVASPEGSGVRNGSFRVESGDWQRTDPCIEYDGETFRDVERFISVGRSVIHCPDALSPSGDKLPVPPSADCDSASCLDPTRIHERRSVLRMRATHPSAVRLPNQQRSADDGVGNVFQTDIHLDAAGVTAGGPDPWIVLRYDTLVLHPVGGLGLEVRIIAERFRENCDPVAWGEAGIWPFGSVDYDCRVETFDQNMLGSPRLACPDASWDSLLPRQFAAVGENRSDDPAGDCYDDWSVEALASGLDEWTSDVEAAWRTEEFEIPVRALPDWDCDRSVAEQIGQYRFTIAFRIPQDKIGQYVGDVEACGEDGCDFVTKVATNYRDPAPRFSAYVEIDQVELFLAEVAAPGPCAPVPSGDDCWAASDSCRTTYSSGPTFPPGAYFARGSAQDLTWELEQGVEDEDSPRHYRRVEFDRDEDPDAVDDERESIGNNCFNCNDFNGTTYRRALREDVFTPATPLVAPCPGDFNGDHRVNGADFGLLLAAWADCGGCPEDLNDDGQVTGADLGLLLSVWGDCP